MMTMTRFLPSVFLVTLLMLATSSGRADSGFVPLFDGATLNGWLGAVDGYEAAEGAIVCIAERGGNLFTQHEYANFVLRFEFKLPPGGNSGIGLRAPLEGRTSRVGIECQVLDDGHEKFANIKPWQRHGSIYGIVPAQPGHLKHAGEWNEQEILFDGTHVKVTLNGCVIVDADLAEYIDKPTLDGRDHPGLKRTSGHIGFLGHGHRVAYRNIRVRMLD
ncbi:MAG: DUF1080 domain-containing protein [Pirellulales bacterium]